MSIHNSCLKNWYWHVELDNDSSELTTFASPFGRYRWLHLPFGLKVSSEIFQKKLLATVDDLTGMEYIHDDVITYGAGDTGEIASADHDRNLLAFLNRCRERNIRLSWLKMKFRRTPLSFVGHVVTDGGLKPAPGR